MNPPVECTGGRDEGDEATGNIDSPSSSSSNSDGMKRAAAKQLIERYYYQLTDGCGKSGCENEFCASCPKFQFPRISKNTAALRAIELLKGKAELCDPSKPSKVAKNGISPVSQHPECQDSQDVGHSACGYVSGDRASTSVISTSLGHQSTLSDMASTVGGSSNQNQSCSPGKQPLTGLDSKTEVVQYLTEDMVVCVLQDCRDSQNWSKLNRLIGSVFNNYTSLMKSFNKKVNTSVSQKESQFMDMELDKDTDETDFGNNASSDRNNCCKTSKQEGCGYKKFSLTIDLESLRRSYAKLFSVPDLPFQSALINALIFLSRELEMDLKYHHIVEKDPSYLNIFITVMEIPVLHTPEFIDSATPHFCRVLGQLPVVAQAGLVHQWASFSSQRLIEMVENLQQLITVKVISANWNRQHFVNDDEVITSACRVMRILFYASVLGGEMGLPEIVAAEQALKQEADTNLQELFQGALGHEPKEKSEVKPDSLAKELGINPLDCRKPLVAWEEFVNEPLCEQIEMEREYRDYHSFKTENDLKFSFLAHPFLLTTAIKNQGMNFDNRMRMLNERRQSIFQTIVHGALTTPYLRLKIRRDHIIDDALVALELVAMDNPQDLKKQLYVEFEGEQGIDEGGVSKEFFQLVVEEMFNPDIGMFTFDDETQNFWFNPTSFENDGQFTLIGIILGLAIYNNVILDIHFPMVVYRKLMGKLGTFDDLKDSHTILANGLQELLDFDGCVEDDMMQTFQITYKDIFGTTLTHDLKEDGENLPVNNENREEFVNLYAGFLLNKSIERQFRAFKRGFQMVTDESPLKVLFRPEEVELLVCGSKNFDFHALEEAAEYDGGFSAESSTIRQFWDIVHAMTDEQKKKLLQFTTGSDRVPVGGLAKLKLIVARNGPDSDRLPTSHTCFNVLLLPEYSSKEKLLERLLKAISYAKGFGML